MNDQADWPYNRVQKDKLPPRDHNKPPVLTTLEGLRERVNDLTSEAGRLIKTGAAKDQATADTAADLANTLNLLSQKVDDQRKDAQREWRELISAHNAIWKPVSDEAHSISTALKQTVIDPFLNAVEAKLKTRAEEKAQLGAVTHPEEKELKATAGTRGRPVSRKTVFEVKITDYYKALDHLKDHPEISALVLKLAQRSIRMGVIVPGTEAIQGKVSV